MGSYLQIDTRHFEDCKVSFSLWDFRLSYLNLINSRSKIISRQVRGSDIWQQTLGTRMVHPKYLSFSQPLLARFLFVIIWTPPSLPTPSIQTYFFKKQCIASWHMRGHVFVSTSLRLFYHRYTSQVHTCFARNLRNDKPRREMLFIRIRENCLKKSNKKMLCNRQAWPWSWKYSVAIFDEVLFLFPYLSFNANENQVIFDMKAISLFCVF